ncbi:ABC transporter permease [Geobacter pelophilus]|uniref:Transport permease protein n=1 Tax=Geoanaerobacter pelophilus TaxID=60036 RepID=A0AAW4L1F8_9BACT|nr:ABC transporter permease [Geoanaerobacter pelophilus]MBT0664544.1 ABC transporter permease [Geoanaerobacter pelophilus]
MLSDEKRDMKRLIYTPSGVIHEGGAGMFRVQRMMITELLSSRELTWRLFQRDFKARYRQSALGVLWAFLMPVVTATMFLVMRNSGVVNIPETGIPYALYAITGLSIWGVFASGVSSSAASLVNAGSMVVKINFPKVSLVVAACIQGLVDFTIRLVLLGALILYYGILPSLPMSCLALLALIPIFLLTFGLGCLLSLISVLFRDIGNLINLGFTGILFITPILYPMREDSLLSRLNYWNPLNYLINVPRDLLLKGSTSDTQPFLITSIFCLVLFLTCWRLFFLAQTKIAERV